MFKPDYVMGDLHLGNDCKLFHRIYYKTFDTVEDYHQGIIDRWNKKVTRDDAIVLVLGDIGKDWAIKEILPKLRGRKYLILGNHDGYSKAFYNQYFEKVFTYPIFVSPRIVFSHIPIPTEPGVINFHGHTHHVFLDSERHFNLCPEYFEYTPILYKSLEKNLGKIDKPVYDFLYEWYKDIQITTAESRDDLITDKRGLIDYKKSRLLVFKHKIKRKIEKGKIEPMTDEQIDKLFELYNSKLDKT